MFVCNVISGYKENEPIKINLYVTNSIWDHCIYRNSYHALSLGNKITADRAILENQQHGAGVTNLSRSPATIPCPMIDDLLISVHSWDAT
jgi:hypothetical protein